MLKKIFKLWCEVRKLRREVKSLNESLDKTEHINKHLLNSLGEKTRIIRELRNRLKVQLDAYEVLKYKLQETEALVDDYKKRWLKTDREANVFMFAVPQVEAFMNSYRADSNINLCAEAYYAERKVAAMTNKMKIHLFDELLEKGYIKKYEPTPEETRYEIRVLR